MIDTFENMRLARKYYLARRMTPKEMATFQRYAKSILTKRELETMRSMRSRFMRKKRLGKLTG